MSLVYEFSFGPLFAGKSATVTDTSSGTEVSGSPLTLDANGFGSLSLAESDYYRAVASNTSLGLNNAVVNGVLSVPDSIDALGGGGGDDGRGTLYLKLLGTNIDVSTSGDNALDVEIDTDRSTGIPDWISETDGVYSITEQGFYLAQIAGSGTCTYASTPASVGIDIYDNALSGVNLGWYSDGSDDSPSFTPAQVNDLQFLCKDTNDIGSNASFPLVLDPVVANNGVEAANTRVTISALLSITKIGSGPRYTEADLA